MGIASADTRARALAAYEAGKGDTRPRSPKSMGWTFPPFNGGSSVIGKPGAPRRWRGGHNPAALDERQMSELDRRVQARPDATLEELREHLGVCCSLVAIHNALGRLGYRYKKNAGGQGTRARGH